MELYRSEDIPIPELTFNDNQDVLDLIMKRPTGIIPVLDEEGMIPRGSWEGFLSKIIKNHHPGNKRFKNKQLTREFSVVHYAGEVTYDPTLFLAKNKDTLAQEIVDELATSHVALISSVFRMVDPDEKSESPASKRSSSTGANASNKMTIGKKFSIQLESLIQNLNSTKPHYIRCIKPNDEKKPNIFMAGMTNEQLTYSGVFEAVIILQSGYPFRLNLFDFRERFHMLILDRDGRNQIFGPKSKSYKRPPPSNLAEAAVLRTQCERLVSLAIDKGHAIMKDSYLGKSKVFYRAPVHYYLVKVRNEIISRGLKHMQRYCRGYTVRKLYRQIQRKTNEIIKSLFKSDMKTLLPLADVIDDLFHRFNRVTPPIISVSSNEAKLARALHNALLVEMEVVQQLKVKLSNKAGIFDAFDQILDAVNKAKNAISFRATVKGVDLEHTWQQNPYLVEVDRNVTYWTKLVSMKKEIKRAIQENDELSLESIVNEVNEMKRQGALDGVVDISDVISPMEKVITSTKQLSESFVSDTLEVFKSGRLVITGTEVGSNVDNLRVCDVNLLRLNYTVSDEAMLSIISYYSQSTEEILARTTSRRVKMGVEAYLRMNAMRSLMAYKAWNKIWHLFPIWKNVLKELPDDSWSVSVVEVNEDIPNPRLKSAENYLMKLSAMSESDVAAIPTLLAQVLRDELVDMIRVCLSAIVIPGLMERLSKHMIPNTLFLHPSASNIDITDLANASDELALFRPVFNPHLRRIFNVSKEHLSLRKAVLTGKHSPVISALREVMNIPNDDADRINASEYEQLFKSYERAKVSVFADGICTPGKHPGFLDLICDPNPLLDALSVLKELKVDDPHWNEFIKIASLLQFARNNCMSRNYDIAAAEIMSTFSKPWWMALSGLGSISSISSTDGHDATTVETILCAKHELKIMLVELKHRLAIANISLACAQGRVVGTLARLDYAEVNDSILSSELAKLRNDVVLGTNEARLLVDCDTLVLIRQHIMKDNWDALGELMVQYYKSSNAFHDCHEATQSEFILCYHGYLDRLAAKKLELASTTHKIVLTSDFDIDTSAFTPIKPAFELLNESIKQAESLEFRSDECSKLLDSVRKLHAIRIAVRGDNWERWKFRVFNNEKLPMSKLMEEIIQFTYSEKDAEYVLNGLLSSAPKQSKLNLASACVEDIISLSTLENERLHPLVHDEFIKINQVLQERRCRALILVSVSTGPLDEKLGSFDVQNVAYKLLTKVLFNVKAMVPVKSAILANWIIAAEAILHIRIAALSWNPVQTDSIALEEYIDTSHLQNILDNLLEPFPKREFELTISVIIDMKNFNRLLSEFDIGRPMMYLGNFNVISVSYESMQNQLNIVKKLENRSDRIDRLMFFADLCVYLRQSLKSNQWDEPPSKKKRPEDDGNTLNLQSVRQCLDEYTRAIKFFRSPIVGLPPEGLVEDIKLIGKEYERRMLVHAFNLAFRDGRITGKLLSLKFNRIRLDSITGIIERVNAWKEQNGDLGTELSQLMNAAVEIRSLRTEASQVQAIYKVDPIEYVSNPNLAGVSIVQSLSEFVAEDVSRRVIASVHSHLANNESILLQWRKIESLLSALAFSDSVSALYDEIALLRVETFARNFVVKMSKLLCQWDQHNRTHNLAELDESFANESLHSIYKHCDAYHQNIESVNEYNPEFSSVLYGINKSVILLYHTILADINGNYDIPTRYWRDELSVSSLHKLAITQSNSSMYSMQTLIKIYEEYPMPLHYSINNIVKTRISYLEDMISFEEMSRAVTSTTNHINNSAEDNENILILDNIDILTLSEVKERLDKIPVKLPSLVSMQQSFEMIIKLRSSLIASSGGPNIPTLYKILDNFLCGGRGDVFELLRYVTSPNNKYPVHSFVQAEFEAMVKYVVDNHIRQLLEAALSEGYVVGERLYLNLAQCSWRPLDICVKYGEFNFPWSIKSSQMFQLCYLVRAYRKAIVQLDPKLTIETVSNELEGPLVAANYPSKDLRGFETIVSLCDKVLESLHASSTDNFYQKNLMESLSNEAELLSEHCRLTKCITELIYNCSTRIIEVGSGGLVVHPTIFEFWKVACNNLFESHLNPDVTTENWFYYLHQFMIGVISLVEKVIVLESKIESRNVLIDIEALSLDQRLCFSAKDIESMLSDITNTNHSVAETLSQSTGESHSIEIKGSIQFLLPGTHEFEELLPLIHVTIEQTVILMRDYELKESALSKNLTYLHDSLNAVVTEHHLVAQMKMVLLSHEIRIFTDAANITIDMFIAENNEALMSTLPSLSDENDDDVEIYLSFPWLSSWLNTGVNVLPYKITSSFDRAYYDAVVRFLSSLNNLQTTYGKLYRTITRLFIELRWCAVCEDWSRGQVISYLLNHLSITEDISIPDASVFRSFVDILTVKRRLEHGIVMCKVYPVIGWSTSPDSEKFLLLLNDYELMDTLAYCDSSFAELCKNDAFIQPLIKISRVLVKIVSRLRCGNWGSSRKMNEFELLQKWNKSNGQNLKDLVDYATIQQEESSAISATSVTFLLSQLKDMISSSKLTIHSTIKSFLSSQLALIEKESKHREIMLILAPLVRSIDIQGQPGKLIISQSCVDALENITDVLSMPATEECMQYSLDLIQMKQSLSIVHYLVQQILQDQTSDEVEVALALLKHMSKLPSYNICESCFQTLSLPSSGSYLREVPDADLLKSYEDIITEANDANSQCILNYLDSISDPSPLNTPSMDRSKIDDHFVMHITGGHILSDLLPLYRHFVSFISLVERNLIFARLYQGFLVASATGHATGSPAQLDLSTIEYHVLDNISSSLLLFGFVNIEDGAADSITTTPYAILYRAIILLRQLRYAQLQNNMEHIKHALTMIEQALIAELNQDNDTENRLSDNVIPQMFNLNSCLSLESVGSELLLASEDWEQRYLISKLLASLQSAGIPLVDDVDSHGMPIDATLSVDIDELGNALKLCENYTPSCAKAIELKNTAETLLTIRIIYRKREWSKLAAFIENMDVNLLESCSLPEIIRAKRTAFVHEALQAVSTSYHTGCFSIPVQIKKSEPTEEDLVRNVQIDCLQNAYELLSRVHESWRTVVIQDHLDACKSLLTVRQHILARNWPAVYDIATAILNPSRIEVKHTFDEVITEIQTARDYASEIIVQLVLKNAIIEGRIGGEVGALDLVQLSTAHLHAAITLANDLHVKGRETVRMLNTAKIAMRLRVAQSRDYWISKGQQEDDTSLTSKSKILPPEVEQAIIKYGKMTVEAAIVEAETLAGQSQQQISEASSVLLVAASPKSSAWMKRMFPGQPTGPSISQDPGQEKSITVTTFSSPVPTWMQAIDYLPEDEKCSVIINPNDKKVESVEDIIAEIEKKNNLSISPDIYDEIAIARDELRYRRVVFSLLVGLRSQGPGGLPGALDCSTINTTTLNQVVAYAEQFPLLCTKSRCKYLLRDAKLLMTARLHRLQNEWKRLRKIVDSVKEINAVSICPPCNLSALKEPASLTNPSPSSGVGLSLVIPPSPGSATSTAYHPVFQSVWEEMRVYDADLSFHLCLAAFAEEMNRKIEYKNSSMLQGSIDMTPVLTLIENARATKAAALIYPSTEFDRLLEAQNLAIELRVRRVYEPNKSTRDLMEKTNIIRTRDARMQLPSFVSFLLTDVTHMSTATDKQQQIQALELAIVSGQQYIRSPLGRINTNEIDVSTLQIVIQTAGPLLKTIGSRSDLLLVNIANSMIQIRKALSSGDWTIVRKAIHDHQSILQADIVREEIDRLLTEADNIEASRALEKALHQGRYTDVVKIAKLIYRPKRKRLQSVIESQYLSEESGGSMHTETVNKSKSNEDFHSAVQTLESLIESTKLLTIRSDETNNYLKAGELILRMRSSMMQGQWDEVKNIVFADTVNESLFPAVALEEIRAVRHGLTYRDVITRIADAMLHGAVSGSPGEVDMHTVDFSPLQEALNASDVSDLHDTNDAMKIMYDFASKLCEIRRAIKESRWSIAPVELFREDRAEEYLEILPRSKAMSVQTAISDISEAVDNFLRYERSHMSLLKQLLQISDDEDDEDSDESDVEKSNDFFPNQSFVPFQSVQSIKSTGNRERNQSSTHKDTDWLVHQWESVKAAKREVRLVIWEMKERNLREKLIHAIENIPQVALRFTSTQTQNASSNRRDDFFYASHNISHSHSGSNPRYQQSNDSANLDNMTHGNDPMNIKALQDIVSYVIDQYNNDADVVSEEINLLLATADIILKFRRAILHGVDLSDYKLLVEEATELRDRGKMSESVGIIELRAYMSASMTVEIIRNELVKALTHGKAAGYIDDLNIGGVEIRALSQWLSSSRILSETAQDLAVGLLPIIREAEILLRIRTAVKLGTWTDLHGLWKSLFNTRGTLREDVVFQYIKAEVYHVNAAHRLRDLMLQLESVLNEYFDSDLEYHYSLLMVKSVHLGSILGQLKQLFSYSSTELIPQTENNILPISPSNKSVKLFECGQVTVHFWSAVCHRYWGDDLLASGDLDNIDLPEDPLLRAVMTRFIQDNLASSALQAASSSLKNFSSQPTILNTAIISAQTFVETFHQVGSSENKYAEPKSTKAKHPSARRISVSIKPGSHTAIAESLAAVMAPATSPGKPGRRSSVAEAYKELRRNSTHNVRLQSTIFHQRSPSIFTSIDRPRSSVLEILATTIWKDYPLQIRKQFDAARNIIIDRALRLRLISCCSTGEIQASNEDSDLMGNLIVPDLNDSLELLHLAMTDETIISEEALDAKHNGTTTVHLSWSAETVKWLRTAKILLSCRSAVVDQRIDDLVSELLAAGFGSSGLGYHDIAADFICDATIPEFRAMEAFAIESVAEQTIQSAVKVLISLIAKVEIIPVSLLIDSSIRKLVDLNTALMKRLEVTSYYKLLAKLSATLLDVLQGAIVGNQYQVLRGKEALQLAPTIPPYPLSEIKAELEELSNMLLIRAIAASNSIPVLTDENEEEDSYKEVSSMSYDKRASIVIMSTKESKGSEEMLEERRLTWPARQPALVVSQRPSKASVRSSISTSESKVVVEEDQDYDVSEAGDSFAVPSLPSRTPSRRESTNKPPVIPESKSEEPTRQESRPFEGSLLRSLFGSM
jgi:hypothetical protein